MKVGQGGMYLAVGGAEGVTGTVVGEGGLVRDTSGGD